ncbi:hypothetical protein BD309DRAFT_949509 [Dichomitus squalens]|uniref:Uncharacterized protein n=1 Tax=Dichomitus squalens TaxID=114155 RepID=A0A4Q9PW21_9APHY|nr:hypothetical protein BD309DRAFT_949509 [Dichomitus squalens]TBU58781.1 hypothetical protein BD310DRAFT_926534 [Dichomitus squalens]
MPPPTRSLVLARVCEHLLSLITAITTSTTSCLPSRPQVCLWTGLVSLPPHYSGARQCNIGHEPSLSSIRRRKRARSLGAPARWPSTTNATLPIRHRSSHDVACCPRSPMSLIMYFLCSRL